MLAFCCNNDIILLPLYFNEIIRYAHDEIQGQALDEIKTKVLMKLNPSFLSRRSRISSRSDFICDADFFRRKTDLAEKSTLLYARCFFLAEKEGFLAIKPVVT